MIKSFYRDFSKVVFEVGFELIHNFRLTHDIEFHLQVIAETHIQGSKLKSESKDNALGQWWL